MSVCTYPCICPYLCIFLYVWMYVCSYCTCVCTWECTSMYNVPVNVNVCAFVSACPHICVCVCVPCECVCKRVSMCVYMSGEPTVWVMWEKLQNKTIVFYSLLTASHVLFLLEPFLQQWNCRCPHVNNSFWASFYFGSDGARDSEEPCICEILLQLQCDLIVWDIWFNHAVLKPFSICLRIKCFSFERPAMLHRRLDKIKI